MSHRQRQDMVLLAHIRQQHHHALGSYGQPRMTQELKALGLCVGHRGIGRPLRKTILNRFLVFGAARQWHTRCENAQI